MASIDIIQRLVAWADAYAGDQAWRTGMASRERLLGECSACKAIPMAEEMESAVRAMEQAGRWKECRVLRCEWFCPGLSESERLVRLRAIGLPMSRANYYIYLRTAYAFIEGAFRAEALAEVA